MATRGVIWAALAAALVGAALCQDGLSCTNIGQTWHHQCNTCSCRENVIVCTKDRCSGTDRNPITEASCLAGSKWKDGCGNTCLCDPSGKRRCTVGSCSARVRSDRSITFIRATGDACAEGDTWEVDCHSCSCQGGKAVCTTERCPRRPPPEPIACEPDDQWEDECGNLCECNEDGRASCTLLPCEPGLRAGVRRRPILRSGDSCTAEGSRWQQDCNECDCVSGVVSCTRKLCATALQHDKYGKCQLNTRWVDECDNQCFCTVRGVPSCTLNECPYGRKEGVQSHFLLEDGSSCSNEGERWRQGCSLCQCSTGRVSCSHRGCPELTQRTALLPEPEWMSCREDTTWEDECGNICSCWLGGPLCTRMGCPKGRTAGKPVKFITFDGDSCSNEGDTWKDDCNTCSCTNGVVECTKKFCKKQTQNVRFISPFMAMTCTPGKRWIDECDNTCFCPDTGHSSCTMLACPPGKRPMVPVRYIQAHGDTCSEEGSSWRHECNTCRCAEGRVKCTRRRCHQLLRSTVLSVSGSADPTSGDKQCEGETEWTDECDNHCRCSPGGLVMCTIKVCAPGKQAGRPLKKRPKLGEPCQDGDDTWLDDCNTCMCVHGVTACTREACAAPEQELDGVPVQQCRPDSSWLDECDNQCSCSADGRSYCSLKPCPHGQQYGVPKKFVRAANSTCADEGATWRQDCNTCSCTGGRIACTEDKCEVEVGITTRRNSRCIPGSKWTDQCQNTCRCTASAQPACSSKACPPGKTAGVPVEKLPRAGDRCDDEGSSWKEDCNKCSCSGGIVRCTEQICTPLEANDEGPCREGEEWIDECTNRCKCIGGEPRCTRRPCQQGGRPGAPARFVVPDGEGCDNEGERWQEDCNTCRCEDELVSCTKEPCVGLERGGGKKKPGNCPYVPPGTLGICINGCNGDDMCDGDEKCCSNGCGAMCMKPDSCLEGRVWAEHCNECECLNGEPICTSKICSSNIQFDRPSPADSPASAASPEHDRPKECIEGSVWKKDCNTCDCVHGRAICTKMLCPSKPASPVDETTGECREGSVWKRDCNTCRCIGGRAVCAMRVCSTKPDRKPGESDVCRLPPVERSKTKCTGFIRRWTFDSAAGKCRRYVYGGCHGTQNLFRTKRQCKKRCRSDTAQSSRVAACRLPVQAGPCFEIIPRYFFDTQAGKCRQFGYSGCGANANNFETLDSCITACGGTYTSKDSHCDRRKCAWPLYQHYTDRGCEPVYDNQACCPTRFECPTIRDSAREKCQYRGKEYSIGDPVPEASQLDPCKQECQCRSSEGGAKIDCAEVDCPARVWNEISAGCVTLYLPDRCCPVSVKCPTVRQRRSVGPAVPPLSPVTCQVDNTTYHQGEPVPVPGDPCLECVCTGLPDSRLDGVTCRLEECPAPHPEVLERGCVPVYTSEKCCPVDWKCPEMISPPRGRLTALTPTEAVSESMCAFGSRRVARGFPLDVDDRCTICECLTPPEISCRKVHCPRVANRWELPQGAEPSSCVERDLGPGACCPEVVCVAPVLTPPVLAPECAGKECHLPAGREGCDVVYRAGECCPRLECRHPVAKQDPADELLCDPLAECSSDCAITRDQYGCPQCDCNSTDDQLTARSGPVVCERQFCPVGCPSHYEAGCIVCECETKRKSQLKRMAPIPITTTPPPCPVVTCRPHCGYKRGADGCTVCDCPPTPTPITTPPPPTPCISVTCWPHCGYKRNPDGCTVCDCPPTTTPMTTTPTPTPCISVTCLPHCGYKLNSKGCTICDCPPSTTPMTTTPTPRPCPTVTCRPHCGYKKNAEGCTVCDCPSNTRRGWVMPGEFSRGGFSRGQFYRLPWCPHMACLCRRPRRNPNGCLECDC